MRQQSLFPEPIGRLPEAAVGLEGATAHLSQGEGHQILFMRFDREVDLPEHRHAAQWGVVLEGRIDLVIDGEPHRFSKGDRYFIPEGVLHSGRIHEGYADITFFDQADRYAEKPATGDRK